MKNRNLYILIGTILLLGGFFYISSDQDEGSNTKSLDLTTVKVQRGDLEKKEEYNGTIRQVDKSSIRSSLTGVVTYLPEEGSVINFGQVLYSVDGKPVVLLEGSIPFYRTLDLTSKDGPDIKQLEQSLIDMGYAQVSFVADETFDEETSDMLNYLYIDYGIETKAEITATEQIAINSKNAEVETIEEAISSGDWPGSGGFSVLDVNYLPSYTPSYIEELGITPGQCINRSGGGGVSSSNSHPAGEYKVAAYDSSGSLIAYSTPLVLERYQNYGPTLTVPDDMTQFRTVGGGWWQADPSFTVTLTSNGPDLEPSPTNLSCSMSVPDQQSISFSHPVHTSTLQTLEVSGIFPLGTTTVSCNGYSVSGINANRQGDEFPTFDITVVDTAAAAAAAQAAADAAAEAAAQAAAAAAAAAAEAAAQAAAAASTIVIPDWIKFNAGWWADGSIDDSTFVTGLQWLITNGIMVIG